MLSRFDQHAGASDIADVAGCASGNGDALQALYSRYGLACFLLARSVLLDVHYAEDVVQEVYLELWCHPDRFDNGRSSVRSWLLMLTHRKAVDRVRSEQLRRTLTLVPEHDCADTSSGPDAQALVSVLGQQARQALAALPAVKREVVVLAYWGGYSQKEIAALTSTPLGTVKDRMRRALNDLNKQFGADDGAAASAG